MLTKILIIDDEDLFREDLGTLLQQKGCQCRTAETAEKGLEIMKQFSPSIILCDIFMPGRSGVDILDDIHLFDPECSVIMMTARGGVDTAVKAFRKGAVDYLVKPFDIEDLLAKIQRVTRNKQLTAEIKYLRRETTEAVESLPMVGKSREMKRVLEMIDRVATAKSFVLISGESGTGKELAARAIHEKSHFSSQPFVAINCSGFSENLLESELFGHVRGAFTGAVKDRAGFFEVAATGTIFLDEISEMPLPLQSKLLRTLEEREFYRVGSTKSMAMQARVITASNKDLKQLTDGGSFRQDLYYRIAVFEIHLPPLRERIPDIPLLADYFLRKINREMKTHFRGFAPGVMQVLMAYNWPGNVRELRNIIERTMILSTGDYISPGSLPPQMTGGMEPKPVTRNLQEAKQAFEYVHICQVLQDCRWNKEKAARLLGVNPSTLYRKMADLGIENQSTEKEKDDRDTH